jgi:virulence-associated protein VagC
LHIDDREETAMQIRWLGWANVEITAQGRRVMIDPLAGPRDGRRRTRASVSQRFAGDLAGDGTAEWLMAYQPDGRARFVGLQVVDAKSRGTSRHVRVRDQGGVRRRGGKMEGLSRSGFVCRWAHTCNRDRQVRGDFWLDGLV